MNSIGQRTSEPPGERGREKRELLAEALPMLGPDDRRKVQACILGLVMGSKPEIPPESILRQYDALPVTTRDKVLFHVGTIFARKAQEERR